MTPLQAALIPEGRAGVRLPTLPGMVRGIVGVSVNKKGRNVYTLQCENCLALETPAILVLMTFRFHSRTPSNNPRLCKPCRIEGHAGCECEHCREDKQKK